jgi:hypothetical protein
MSPVNCAEVGEVHVTYISPALPNASFGRFSPSAATGSTTALTRTGDCQVAPLSSERCRTTCPAWPAGCA